MGSTVDAVMEEEAQEPLLRPRRGLFSRKRLMETEELYAPPEPEEAPEEIPEIDTIGPEPELAEAAADYRAEAKRRKHPILAAVLISLLPVIPMGIEAYGYEIRYWTGDAAVQSGVLLACLAAVAVLAQGRYSAKAFGSLLQKRSTSELLAVVSGRGDGGGLCGPAGAAGAERPSPAMPRWGASPWCLPCGAEPGRAGDCGTPSAWPPRMTSRLIW